MSAGSRRLWIGRSLLRAAFRAIKPKRFYEPVEIGGRRHDPKRDADSRWHAIEEVIRDYQGRNLVDIGCAEGWFVRQAAVELSCFAIGVEAAERRLLLGEISRLHDNVERAATMKALLRPADIRNLPRFDLALCLSVVHHVFRQGGRAAALEFLAAVAGRVEKALIFEMGTSDETELRWSKVLPEMPEGQEAFVRELLAEAGFINTRIIAATPGIRKDAPRLMFVAEPRARL